MTNRVHTGYVRLQNFDQDSTSNFKSRLQGQSYDSSDSAAESDSQSTQLRRVQKKSQQEKWPGSASQDFIEHVIKPGETIQGLALQYRVSLFELKRANSIDKEVEFHARRVLKIPVSRHSWLKEAATVGQLVDLAPAAADAKADADASPSHGRGDADFLEQVDQDLQRIKERARVYDIDQDADLRSEPSEAVRSARLKRTDCSGDNWGLSWTQLVCMALLVLLVCPLFYFLHLELTEHRQYLEQLKRNRSSSAA